MDKITKLSDAIRLGATFHPQCRRRFTHRAKNQEILATCALGAAMEATGILRTDGGREFREILRDRFPGVPLLLINLCIMYNDHDDYHWSREKIADWLEKKGY